MNHVLLNTSKRKECQCLCSFPLTPLVLIAKQNKMTLLVARAIDSNSKVEMIGQSDGHDLDFRMSLARARSMAAVTGGDLSAGSV